jgi:AraC-like DNA-binding protein
VRECLFQPFPMQGARRAQIWRYAQQYRRPRHFHAEPELDLIVAGTGKFGTGDAAIEVEARDLLCWPPGCDHELLEASADFDLYVVALTPELSDRVLGASGAKILSGPTRVRLSATIFAQLLTASLKPLAELEALVVETHVAEFWRSAHAARRTVMPDVSLGRRVLASLLEEPDLPRDDRARLVCAYPTELSRHFRRAMGMTLTEYRTRLRLLRLIERVDSGSNMLVAALEAGFGSYSQCHRAFTRVFGCTPRRFFCSELRREMIDTFAPWCGPRVLVTR